MGEIEEAKPYRGMNRGNLLKIITRKIFTGGWKPKKGLK
jgi:hypothetical protein